MPIVDTIPYWIDTRVITTGFKAEKNLTKGTVPVDVDAVLFWKVLDPKKADHAAMRHAVTEARKTVGKFILALNHPAPGQQDFEVKKPFIQGDQVEHIWLSDVRFVGNRFQGRLDNQPRKIRGLKLGQLVSVNPDEISDWLYVDNGKLVGGYTVRAHYNELSPQQKQQFDRDADFKIGRQWIPRA